MRKTRSDKWEDRINTRTKYAIYSSLSLLAWFAYGYSHVDTEIIFREIDRPYKIEVEKPVIEYITLPCNPVTKNAQ